MCDSEWDVLAEIHLQNRGSTTDFICVCSRFFVRTKYQAKRNSSFEHTASEDDPQNEEDTNEIPEEVPVQKDITAKLKTEQEAVSCYCSASQTDNLSTDEHDSLRDCSTRGIQQSDSGTDLREHSVQDVAGDWNRFWALYGEKLIWKSWIDKYSAYINPDYLQRDFGEGSSFSVTDVRNKEKVPLEELPHSQLPHKTDNSTSKEVSKKNVLLRNLSLSEEKIFADVSEGWNPLSPVSVDEGTEAERLLSSRCGSYTSGSLKTLDSMTNVTGLTVSSLNSSRATSSSDSISSVSSVNSSISSEDLDEDYQSQWNELWQRHYEDEYLVQYNKFIESVVTADSLLKIEVDSADSLDGSLATLSVIPSEKIVIQETSPQKIVVQQLNSTVHSLDNLLDGLNMTDAKVVSETSDDENDTLQTEMLAMGLPTAFGHSSKTCVTTKTPTDGMKDDSFNSGRNRVRAAFNVLGIEFQENPDETMTGHVDYKMKHIRLQNRHLKIRPEAKKPKHCFFDDDGNMIENEESAEEVAFHDVLSDSSDNQASSCEDEPESLEVVDDKSVPTSKRRKRKRKQPSLPPEIRDNRKLTKYWKKRFTLFSKFDQGIKLDEESWYSVTPELVAKHAAERCKCDTIVDAFCGAGGNSIQFALTCKRVIAIDIDPNKIELAMNNAEVYGVSHKIDFITGDFFELAESLKGDVVFLSPPWGGPNYLNQPLYDLEKMLQPLPFSQLIAVARKISPKVAAFLPRNSNTCTLVKEAGLGGKVEIQQNFINKKLIAITAYYNELIKEK
nr:uncharacterized protein LOC111505903 [Leptinotarsa decemlineata]